MWSLWQRSLVRVHSQPKSPSNFSCTSFRDVPSILAEEPEHGSVSKHHSRKSTSLLHQMRVSTSKLTDWVRRHAAAAPSRPSFAAPPSSDGRVVVYFTSLHIVRRTFEDCKAVRSILQGFQVPIDERDVSMDAKFVEELQRITGLKKPQLPSVFVSSKYVGGADEIRQLFESGELKKMVGGLPVMAMVGCGVCGGHRFVVCGQCNGSHKVFDANHRVFRTCVACNPSGLTGCPSCTHMLLRCG